MTGQCHREATLLFSEAVRCTRQYAWSYRFPVIMTTMQTSNFQIVIPFEHRVSEMIIMYLRYIDVLEFRIGSVNNLLGISGKPVIQEVGDTSEVDEPISYE
jgi:hypothetical protein